MVGLTATDGRAIGARGGPNHYHPIPLQSSKGGGTHTHSISGSGSANTSDDGNHDHAPPGGSFLVGSLVQTVPAGGSTFYSPQNVHGRTGAAGSHHHSVSISVSGSSSQEAAHTHQFDGNTSGGYDTRPSFAGVHYIIGSGVVPT